MKLAHYFREGKVRIGVISGDNIYDLEESSIRSGVGGLANIGSIDELLSLSKLDLLEQFENEICSGTAISLNSVRLGSPILRPQKIYCAAINYVSHGKEQEVRPPSEPYFFSKFGNTIIGVDDPILIPKISMKVDWEVELAVIIGKKGKYIPRERAIEHVAGYTVANDVSYRDLQLPEGYPQKVSPLGQNWMKGKGLDNALPLGPCMVTPGEIGDIYDKRISLSVNGSIKQDAKIGEMLFKVDQLIQYASDGITLLPGDVISTGTPNGVAVFTGVPFLKEGDLVEAEIQGIGKLRNPVMKE